MPLYPNCKKLQTEIYIWAHGYYALNDNLFQIISHLFCLLKLLFPAIWGRTKTDTVKVFNCNCFVSWLESKLTLPPASSPRCQIDRIGSHWLDTGSCWGTRWWWRPERTAHPVHYSLQEEGKACDIMTLYHYTSIISSVTHECSVFAHIAVVLDHV